MSRLFAHLPWITPRATRPAPRPVVSRQQMFRCRVLDGAMKQPVACAAPSADEAARMLAWEAVAGIRTARDEVVIRVQVEGETVPRVYHFGRSWQLEDATARQVEGIVAERLLSVA
jgi:hypothetical protein